MFILVFVYLANDLGSNGLSRIVWKKPRSESHDDTARPWTRLDGYGLDRTCQRPEITETVY